MASQRSMKVLWLRPSTGDNISVRRERIAAHLAEKGVDSTIVDASGLDALGAIRTAIGGDFDVIVGNVRIGLFLGYPLATVLRTPLVGDVSDPISDVDDLPWPLFECCRRYEWFALSGAGAAVFVYESSFQEAQDRGIEHAVKLPNAVDFEFFAEPDDESVEESRSILIEDGVDLTKPVAIYVGGFTENYRIRDILDAAEVTPEWEFVFVGEAGQVDLVERAAAELENVHFPGAFEYELMPGFLHHADVGFCFKDAEQPLKLKEYGAAGLPTIVQPGELERWYGADELLVVEPDGEAISALLADVLDGGTDAGKRLQETVRQYSWSGIAEEYYEILTRLAGTDTVDE